MPIWAYSIREVCRAVCVLGLEQHSIALCEQVTALNFDRIIDNIGKVDEGTLAQITEAVQMQVGVFDKYN